MRKLIVSIKSSSESISRFRNAMKDARKALQRRSRGYEECIKMATGAVYLNLSREFALTKRIHANSAVPAQLQLQCSRNVNYGIASN